MNGTMIIRVGAATALCSALVASAVCYCEDPVSCSGDCGAGDFTICEEGYLSCIIGEAGPLLGPVTVDCCTYGQADTASYPCGGEDELPQGCSPSGCGSIVTGDCCAVRDSAVPQCTPHRNTFIPVGGACP